MEERRGKRMGKRRGEGRCLCWRQKGLTATTEGVAMFLRTTAEKKVRNLPNFPN